MKEFEESGQWWLPSRLDHKIGGRLTYNPTRGGKLDLEGALWTAADFDKESPFQEITGS